MTLQCFADVLKGNMESLAAYRACPVASNLQLLTYSQATNHLASEWIYTLQRTHCRLD